MEIDDWGPADDILENMADDGHGFVGSEEGAEGGGVDAVVDLREERGLDVVQGVGKEGSEDGGIGPALCAATIYDPVWPALHDGNGVARGNCVGERRQRDCGREARQEEARQHKDV